MPGARVNLNAGLGPADGFSSVDFRIVLRPWFRKSMSSLSSRISLTCPIPNFECSIQFVGFHFIKVLLSRVAFKASTNSTIDEGSDQRPEVRKTTQPFLMATAFSFFDNMPQGNCNSVQNCTLFEPRIAPRHHRRREQMRLTTGLCVRACGWLFPFGCHCSSSVARTVLRTWTQNISPILLVLPAWTNQPIYLPATRLNDISATRGGVTHL